MIQISRITLLVITNFILIVILIVGAFYSFNKTSEKAAFVNSSKVLSQFMGMKETQEVYQKKVAAWQSKLDTLQQKIIERENAIEELSGKEKELARVQLNKSKESFLSQKEAWEKEATIEGNNLTQGMLNQINTFIEKYAKEHGYLIVHGSTTSGSILYADEKIDITEDIIQGLNAQYKK